MKVDHRNQRARAGSGEGASNEDQPERRFNAPALEGDDDDRRWRRHRRKERKQRHSHSERPRRSDFASSSDTDGEDPVHPRGESRQMRKSEKKRKKRHRRSEKHDRRRHDKQERGRRRAQASLEAAVLNGAPEEAKQAIEKGADANSYVVFDERQAEPCIVVACRLATELPSRSSALVATEVQRGNAAGSRDSTFGIGQGRLRVVRALLEGGCDANASNMSTGVTALHVCVLAAHAVLTGTLVSHGANIHALDAFGSTPLTLGAAELLAECARRRKALVQRRAVEHRARAAAAEKAQRDRELQRRIMEESAAEAGRDADEWAASWRQDEILDDGRGGVGESGGWMNDITAQIDGTHESASHDGHRRGFAYHRATPAAPSSASHAGGSDEKGGNEGGPFMYGPAPPPQTAAGGHGGFAWERQQAGNRTNVGGQDSGRRQGRDDADANGSGDADANANQEESTSVVEPHEMRRRREMDRLAWQTFEMKFSSRRGASIGGEPASLTLIEDVPWPSGSEPNIASLELTSQASELRKLQRQWHPDKFSHIFGDALAGSTTDIRDQILLRVKGVSQSLNALAASLR